MSLEQNIAKIAARQRDETLSGGSELDFLDKTLGAAALGLTKDPIVGALTGGEAGQNFIAKTFGFESAMQFEQALDTSSLAQAMQFAGEWSPMLVGGVGMFNFGRKAAVKAGQFGMQLFAKEAGKNLIRGLEMVGGSAGFGAFDATRAAAEGKDAHDIAKAGLYSAGFALAWEGAAFGIGKAFMRGFGKDVSEAVAGSKVHGKALAGVLKKEAEDKAKIVTDMLGVPEQEVAVMDYLIGEGLIDITKIATVGKAVKKGQQHLFPAGEEEIIRAIVKTEKFQEAAQKAKGAQTLSRGWNKILETLDSTAMQEMRWGGNPAKMGAVRESVEEVAVRYFKAPEAVTKELGPFMHTLGRTMTDLEGAAKIVRQKSGQTIRNKEKELFELVKDHPVIAKIIEKEWKGLSLKEKAAVGGAVHTNGWGLQLQHDFEVFTGSQNLAEATYGKKVYELFKDVQRHYDDQVMRAENAGSKWGKQTYDALKANGVQEYMAHSVRLDPSKSYDDIFRGFSERIAAEIRAEGKLAGKPISKTAAEIKANEIAAGILGETREGLPAAGSLKYHRQLKGTLRDKVEKYPGIFENNIFRAAESEIAQREKRVLYMEAFGPDLNKAKEVFHTAALSDGANARIVDKMLGAFFEQTPYSAAMNRMATNATGIQTFSKMTFGTLANATGPINIGMVTGYKNQGKALIQFLRREKFEDIAHFMAIQSTAWDHVMVGGMGEPLADTFISRMAAGSLKVNGFSLVEGWNQTWSKLSAYVMIKDTLAKEAAGMLRGKQRELAQRRFARIGLDFDQVIKEGGYNGLREGGMTAAGPMRVNKLELALAKATEVSQALPSKMTTPLDWDHPFGRIAFQYKRFAFGQGRQIRDSVFKEAVHGNVKPLAMLTVMYPLAGEMVGAGKATLRGKDFRSENDFLRYFQAISMVGGFGLAHDLINGSQHGRLLDTMLGPTVNDVTQLLQSAATLDEDKAKRQITRQPVYQGAKRAAELIFGAADWGVDSMNDYLSALEELGGGRSETALHLDGLLGHAASQKLSPEARNKLK